jgi:hypothetical protein
LLFVTTRQQTSNENILVVSTPGRDVPRLILAHNVHGIDIDLRCTQIAALALWLRCQRAYQGKDPASPQREPRSWCNPSDTPAFVERSLGLLVTGGRSSWGLSVCAEPMPGEEQMLKEFIDELEPKLLGQLVEVVFDKMTSAGGIGVLDTALVEVACCTAQAARSYFVLG